MNQFYSRDIFEKNIIMFSYVLIDITRPKMSFYIKSYGMTSLILEL